jgi:phosphoribosyl 1,2-cyclic phosphate phosphodiesterase
MLEITFLGTGTSQGIPVIACDCATCVSQDRRDNRLRTSVLVKSKHATLIIDTGPDFREQMLRARNMDLDAVLITHEHNDHLIGIDEVRTYNFKQQREMPVYAMERVLGEIRVKFAYALAENSYPGAPQLALHEIYPGKPFHFADMQIMPILVQHGSLPILGFRINDFCYLTDIKHIDESQIELIKGSKVLVLSALRKEMHHSHLSLNEAIRLANHLNVPQVYFTHFSHRMGPAKQWENYLPEGIDMAYDELVIQC